MIENSWPAPSVSSKSTAANKSKLKIQVLICRAGHWEIKLLLIDWTVLVCACWNLIKRRLWKVTVDNSIRVKQVEPKLVYLRGLFPLQSVFSWVGTHSHGFVQFPISSLQASSLGACWVYHIRWEKFSGMSVATILAASFWQSLQPHSNHFIFYVQGQKASFWLSKGEAFIRGKSSFSSTAEERREIVTTNACCKVSSGDLPRVAVLTTAEVDRLAGLPLSMEQLVFWGSTHMKLLWSSD